VPPGADHKSAVLSTPQICLQKIEMKEDHISCLFKDTRIKKASWKSQSNTYKLKWVLFFIVDYESCFFCLSPSFSSLIFQFFAFFTYGYTIYIRTNPVAMGGFGGLSPPNEALWISGILLNVIMPSPPAQTQSPPQNCKAPYWKLSGDGSDTNPPCFVKFSALLRWFLISSEPTAWLFDSLLIPGDQTKN